MSETTTNVEDSIKIALDAADMATSAASELDRIRNDNVLVRNEMKKIYRNTIIVLLSALSGSAISIFAAAIIYYKTLSGMETANNTSLEALVIFAENVDKLTAATTSVQDISGKLGGLSADASKTVESVASLDEKFGLNQADIITRVEGLQEHIDGSVSQFSRSVLDDVSSTLSTQAGTVDRKLGEIGQTTAQIMSLLGGATATGGTVANTPAGLTKSQVDEIIGSLQKILIAQATITSKLNGMKPSNSNTNGKMPQIKPASRPSTDGMIKFP
ncbi:hypothetical protein [Cypionkella sp.]|uniref:hypothetical protein n=1 Tax=Cypionkella sp. TaxID=2811411 RepID=UPI002FDE9CAB